VTVAELGRAICAPAHYFEREREERVMDDEVKLALNEVNINLTRALDALEDVPPEAFANPEDRYRLGDLIVRAGGIVASEEIRLARGDRFTLDCSFPPIYSKGDEE
jgi:hypothetical protein